MFENIANSIGVRYDRLVYRQPEGHSQWLDPVSNIERGVEVGVTGIPARVAKEKSLVSRSDLVAHSASLACVFWVNIDGKASFLHSLVFNKALQLSESPRMQLSIERLSFVGINVCYSFQ